MNDDLDLWYELCGDDLDRFNSLDPVLLSLVRRAMPNLIAYDVLGVQPMTGPSGQIFAMRSKYDGSPDSDDIDEYNLLEKGISL